jgi:uncharacterized protein (UPF0261 family)
MLHDLEANAAFVKTLREQLDRQVRLLEVDLTINDPSFAELAVDMVLELLGDESLPNPQANTPFQRTRLRDKQT